MSAGLLGWVLAVWTACPFCPPSSPPFAEQLAQSDAAVLVKWVRNIPAKDEQSNPQTVFEVIEVLRAHRDQPTARETIAVPYILQGRPGDLFLIIGQRLDDNFDWALPVEVTEISYAYIKQAPSPEVPATERLTYFLKFLQFSDPTIANDAFAEFSRAPYDDVYAIRDRLSAAQVRKWMETLPPAEQLRQGFYGLLLGLCGGSDDAEYLRQQVFPPTPQDQVRLGLDGMMAGYVLLTGNDGLQKLLAAKLDAPGQPDGDVYATINAMRFLWQFAPQQVSRERIEAACTSLLERPSFAEVAIIDLARWEHWAVMDRVIGLYGREPFDTPFAKHKVIQFALACLKSSEKSERTSPAAVASARAFIERLQQTEPETLQNAQRFLRLREEQSNAGNDASPPQ